MARAVLYTCQCCGYAEAFNDPEEAFEAGWDAPPYFSTHVVCPLCPFSCAAGMDTHKQAHNLWAKEGRPSSFSIEKCASDSIFGNQRKIEEASRSIKKLRRLFKQLRRKNKSLH